MHPHMAAPAEREQVFPVPRAFAPMVNEYKPRIQLAAVLALIAVTNEDRLALALKEFAV